MGYAAGSSLTKKKNFHYSVVKKQIINRGDSTDLGGSLFWNVFFILDRNLDIVRPDFIFLGGKRVPGGAVCGTSFGRTVAQSWIKTRTKALSPSYCMSALGKGGTLCTGRQRCNQGVSKKLGR